MFKIRAAKHPFTARRKAKGSRLNSSAVLESPLGLCNWLKICFHTILPEEGEGWEREGVFLAIKRAVEDTEGVQRGPTVCVGKHVLTLLS